MNKILSLVLALFMTGQPVEGVQEQLQGYWEEGYAYYLEFSEDQRLTVRDYAKRVVLETGYDLEAEDDASTIILLDETGLRYAPEDDPLIFIRSLRLEGETLYLTEEYPLMEKKTAYELHKVDHGPFSNIIIGDELLPDLEGRWDDEEGFYVLEIENNMLYLYWGSDNERPAIAEPIHLISYAWDDSGQKWLVPEDLTRTDFQGYTAFRWDDEADAITTQMEVFDADQQPVIRFHRATVETPLIPEPPVFEDPICYKPVIYLYPKTACDVTVTLDLDGELTCTYPRYNGAWRVTAQPDGTLTDTAGQSYNYLYWEGIVDADFDFSHGFCVPGDGAAAFLESALADLGLTRREANEFIVYWLPQMEQNPYNLITFQTAAYTDAAKLTISPAPDTLLRVFMAWKPLAAPIDIEPQVFTHPERIGFTAVEWGGTMCQ